MRALVRGATGLCVMQRAALQPGAGEVVVTVHSCGICGSDVHMAEAGLGQPGGIPGHEFSGTISALGQDVVGWQRGDVQTPQIGHGGQPAVVSATRKTNTKGPAGYDLPATFFDDAPSKEVLDQKRGFYELGTDVPSVSRLADAFAELALVI